MRVRAKILGFRNGGRVRAGTDFDVPPAEFYPSWMEPLEPLPAPAEPVRMEPDLPLQTLGAQVPEEPPKPAPKRKK